MVLPLSKKHSFFLLPLFITCVVFIPVFLFLFGRISTAPQVFHDIIIENVAKSGLNKTGELHLFWGILFSGILFLLCLTVLLRRLPNPFGSFTKLPLSDTWRHRLHTCSYALLLLFPNLFHYIIYKEYNAPLFILGGIYLFFSLTFPDYAADILCLYVLCYYGVTGILTIVVRFFPSFPVHLTVYGFGIATLLCLGLLITSRMDCLKPVLLFVQLPVTGVLGIYFVDNYLYQGKTIHLPFAPGYYLFFALVIGVLLFMQLKHIFCSRKQLMQMKLSNIICSATVITIFIYNSFSACPMYAQPDQHHHGEQMIPWHQVVDMGQGLYTEYTPVSGLFPMVIGAIQHLLLGGTASDYSPAVSILMVLVCILTMYLIYRHTGGTWALLFAVLFCLPSYNRQYLVLPILLLLSLPELLKRKQAWLLCWIFSCFLAGLYYPLFGAAVLLGTLPIGIFQFADWLKSPKDFKKPLTLISILLVFVPIFFSIPLLFRILRHTLTYSSQTILADGICLYNQETPVFFMPWLAGHEYLRDTLYLVVRFFLPVIGVWIFVLSSIHCFFSYKKTSVTILKCLRSHRFLLILGGGIALCISYTYTLVRADTGVILSRTSYILCAVLGIFLPVLLLPKKPLPMPFLFLLACLVSLPMILYRNTADVKTPAMWVYPNGEADLFLDDSLKLYSQYEVPETFLKAEDTSLPEANLKKLGGGFIVADQLDYIFHYADVIKKCSAQKDDMTYMGFDGQGFYYFTDVKACATGFIQAGKGYEAQQEIIRLAAKKRPVIFLMEPDCTYYVYFWMHTNDYVYCADDDCFYPEELYSKVYPDQTPDDYRQYASPTDFGLVADSFGKSADTLLPLMTDAREVTILEKGNTFELSLDAFDGKDYDMLFLKLDTDALIAAAKDAGTTPPAAVTISFQDASSGSFDSASIHASIGDGTLFIPAGMNPCWLLSGNLTNITLSFDGGTDYLPADCVTEAVLYKIRQ